jgi:hypothetical protein
MSPPRHEAPRFYRNLGVIVPSRQIQNAYKTTLGFKIVVADLMFDLL